MMRTFFWTRDPIVATGEGISGLRLRPTGGGALAGFRRRTLMGMTPWSQIGDISVHSGFWGTVLRLRLVDEPAATLDVQSVSRRWLDTLASSLDRLRSSAA